jgi:leader peptidase (prepilin peptidase)/N-methyltransferase
MDVDAIFTAHNWAVVPFHFWSLVFFSLGCIVGSFLNVCIHRMPLEMSVVSPPSHCPHCKYSIPFYLNIPLVTWLLLRGRCKNCGAPISVRYFVVELLTGVVFLACWLAYGHYSPWVALVLAVFTAGLIVATFIDFEHYIIPDEITLGGTVAGIIIAIILPSLHGTQSHPKSLGLAVFGAAFGASIVYAILRLGKLLFGRQKLKVPPDTKIIFSETSLFLAGREIPYQEIFYRKSDVIIVEAQRLELVDRSYKDVSVRLSPSLLRIGDESFDPVNIRHMEAVSPEVVVPREAMGLGDVKFMGAIGAFLGWQGALFSLMASSIIGAVVGIVLIAIGKRAWSSRMPYGPYIALAAVIWIFLGRRFALALFG